MITIRLKVLIIIFFLKLILLLKDNIKNVSEYDFSKIKKEYTTIDGNNVTIIHKKCGKEIKKTPHTFKDHFTGCVDCYPEYDGSKQSKINRRIKGGLKTQIDLDEKYGKDSIIIQHYLSRDQYLQILCTRCNKSFSRNTPNYIVKKGCPNCDQ